MKTLAICLFAIMASLRLFADTDIEPVELSLKTTNDYIFTEIRYTNGICGFGVGAEGSNTVMRFEDVAFLDEAFVERSHCGCFPDGTTSRLERVDHGISPFIHLSPSVWNPLHVLYETLSMSNYCCLVSGERLGDVTDKVHDASDSSPARVFKPDARDPWKGFVRFEFYPTNDPDRVSFRIPLITTLTRLAYENLERGKFCIIGERRLASDEIQTRREDRRRIKTYTLDTQKGWVIREETNRVDYSYESYQQLPWFTAFDYYSMRKISYHDDSFGHGDAQGFQETIIVDSLLDSDDCICWVDIPMFEGQRLLSVTNAFVCVNASWQRYVDNRESGGETVTTNIIPSSTLYVPISPENARLDEDGRRIVVNISISDVKAKITSYASQVAPSIDGPALSDMISYPRNIRYSSAYNEVYSHLSIRVDGLVAICEIQWRARVLHNQ